MPLVPTASIPEAGIICAVGDVEDGRHVDCGCSLHLLKQRLKVAAPADDSDEMIMAINDDDDDDKDFQLSLTLLPRTGSQSWVLGSLLPEDLARTLLTTPRPPDKDGEGHRGKCDLPMIYQHYLVSPLDDDPLYIVLHGTIHLPTIALPHLGSHRKLLIKR